MNKRDLYKNILLLAITISVTMILLEFSLRFFYPQLTLEKAEELSIRVFGKSDYTPWKLKPNSSDIMHSLYNEYNAHIKINSYGLRDNEFNINKDKNVYRIFVLGDSMTWGLGVELEDTYPKKLENLLNQRNNKNNNKMYESINAGRADGGNAPDIQYLYLKNKGLNFSPDMVIVGFFVGNDITDITDKSIWAEVDSKGLPTNITSNYYYVDEQNRLRRIYENKDYYKKYNILSNVNYFLSKKSHLFILLKNFFIEKTEDPSKIFFERFPEDLIKNFDKIKILLKEMKKVSNEKNASFVVVLVPAKTQVLDKDWEKYQKYYKDFETSRTMPQDLIMDFCEKSNITCIDLLSEFLKKASKGGFYFNIDGHLNEKGHQLASSVIYENLINRDLTLSKK